MSEPVPRMAADVLAGMYCVAGPDATCGYHYDEAKRVLAALSEAAGGGAAIHIIGDVVFQEAAEPEHLMDDVAVRGTARSSLRGRTGVVVATPTENGRSSRRHRWVQLDGDDPWTTRPLSFNVGEIAISRAHLRPVQVCLCPGEDAGPTATAYPPCPVHDRAEGETDDA